MQLFSYQLQIIWITQETRQKSRIVPWAWICRDIGEEGGSWAGVTPGWVFKGGGTSPLGPMAIQHYHQTRPDWNCRRLPMPIIPQDFWKCWTPLDQSTIWSAELRLSALKKIPVLEFKIFTHLHCFINCAASVNHIINNDDSSTRNRSGQADFLMSSCTNLSVHYNRVLMSVEFSFLKNW